MKKNVLIYPCDTEIGLELYRSLSYSRFYKIYGDYKNNSHGNYVYSNFIKDVPFIKDTSTKEDVIKFNKVLEDNHIDIVYPAMDGVISKLAEYRDCITSVIIAPDAKDAKITRSKKLTYSILSDSVRVPVLYDFDSAVFPVFVKPDVGQGSVGAAKIMDKAQLTAYFNNHNPSDTLICEYIDGEEYTVDCFSNSNGELIYISPRQRNRMKNGISVNCSPYYDDKIIEFAKEINKKIRNIGAWFFQIKRNTEGEYVLMEVASRIAGTSGYCRGKGVNLPLLTLFEFTGNTIDSIEDNENSLSLDRALYNSFKLEIEYDTVYVDYDDTLVIDNHVNSQLIAFLYQCLNNGKRIVLLSKHEGDLLSELKNYRIETIFDEIIHLKKEDQKSLYITDGKSIFIDDSYGERINIKREKKIPVFDPSMIECLLEGGRL